MNWKVSFWGVLAMVCCMATAQAQSEPESSTLVIESQQGEKQHEMHVGDRLHYQTKSDTKGKGQIESIQDSSVTVAGHEVAFSDLQTVVHVKGHHRARGSGLLKKSIWGILISGVLLLLTFVLAGGRTTSGERGLLLVFALLALVFFPILLIIALIVLASGRAKYDLGDKWRLRRG
jgi:hypothetical protein